MVSSFLGCFPLKTSYNFAGILYSFIAFISFAYLCKNVSTPDSIFIQKLFNTCNVIGFGPPALFWGLDQIRPSDKYKKRFHCLYLWLTLIWTFLIVAFLGLVFLGFSAWGGEIDKNTALLILAVCLLVFASVSLPTLYIAKCIE